MECEASRTLVSSVAKLILTSATCTLQDCLYIGTSNRNSTMENTARGQQSSSTRHHRDQIPSSVLTVMGFPVSVTQFNVLSKLEFAEFQSQVQDYRDY